MSALDDRVPPHNDDAEQAILGACFLDPAAVLIAQRIVKAPTMFYRQAHALTWAALVWLAAEHAPMDPVSVASRLEATGDLARCGGKEYIAELIDAVATAANIEYHAKIVRECADRRALIALGNDVIRSAWNGENPIEDVVATATNALTPIAVDAADSNFVNARNLVWPTLEHIERLRTGEARAGLTTGWPELDEKMGGGPVPGELVAVVGVPRSGKTAFAVNWCVNAILDRGHTCAFVSAEMRSRQLLTRMLNVTGEVSTQETRTGKMSDDAWRRLWNAGKQLAVGDHLWLDETPGPSIEDVQAKVTLLKQKVPALDYVFVDFLQLIRQRDRRRGDLESSELKFVAYGLKNLAAELNVVVVATVQPNDKQIKERANKRPQLEDIQGTSGVGQASHFVLLCHRPGLFEPDAGDAFEIEIGKARELQQSTVKLTWDGSHVRVTSAGRDRIDQQRRLHALAVPQLPIGA